MAFRFLLFFVLILTLNVDAQKHDNIWILGSKYHKDGDSCQYGIEISFDKEVKINRRLINQSMDAHNLSFSDLNGQLLYYTNGCSIRGFNDKIIQNGDSLNLLDDYKSFCAGFEQEPGLEQTVGYPFANASLFLPLDNGKLLYLSLETWVIPTKYPYVFSPNILSTLIDTSSNKVIYKNREVLSGKSTMSRYGLTACKHVDNKSWWVIARNNIDSVFRILLVTSDSIINKSQIIGKRYISSDLGQSAFSPNGKWFAWYSKTNGLEIMHFDRENGILSEYQNIAVNDTLIGFGGLAFSPNNRFIYVSSQADLYQFDLDSSNIEQSVVHIEHNKEAICGCGLDFPANYYQMQLGPDCKIYMSSRSSIRCLHVIKYPDRKGKECQFSEISLLLPSYNHGSLPEFPNYRINQPYPCDSTIRFMTSNLDFGSDYFFSNVFPNPAFDILNVDIELPGERNIKFDILDINGRLVLENNLSKFNSNYLFDISQLYPGIYFYILATQKGILKNGKFVKL